MIATLVYLLCAILSTVCAIMLYRGFRKSRARLLFWAALCFLGLAVNNTLLFVDVSVGLAMDLSLWRSIPGLVGISALVYGMIWDVR